MDAVYIVGGFALIACIASLGAVLLCWRSLPVGIDRMVRSLSEESAATRTAVDAQDARWLSYKREIDTYVTAVEDSLDQLDKRSKRIAQQERRAKEREQRENPEESGGGGDRLSQLRAQARSRGMLRG